MTMDGWNGNKPFLKTDRINGRELLKTTVSHIPRKYLKAFALCFRLTVCTTLTGTGPERP
jgi:hypothetical protein